MKNFGPRQRALLKSKLSLRFHGQPAILPVRELFGVVPNGHLSHGAMYYRETLSTNWRRPARDVALRRPAAHDGSRGNVFLVYLAGNSDDLPV